MDKWDNKFAFHVYHLTNVFRVVEKVIWNGVTTIFRRYSSGFPGVVRNPTPLSPRRMATTRRGDPGKHARQQRQVRSQSCASGIGDGDVRPSADCGVEAPLGVCTRPPSGDGGST